MEAALAYVCSTSGSGAVVSEAPAALEKLLPASHAEIPEYQFPHNSHAEIPMQIFQAGALPRIRKLSFVWRDYCADIPTQRFPP